jgi:SAM-dependent methyltransferase
MWLSPMPMKEDLDHIYDRNYFCNKLFFKSSVENVYGYYDFMSERFYKQISFASIIACIKELAELGQSPSLLDVGCGLGHLLDVAYDEGFDVEGVEFNPYAVEQTRKKYNFPIYLGDIAGYSGRQFDVITMFDVVEHLQNPFEAMRKVVTFMKPKGMLVLTTMDCDSVVSRILGTRLEDFRRIREHLFFFTRRSMERVLRQNGLEIVRIGSYGHTFRLDFLADRIRLISNPAGMIFQKIVRLLKIEKRMVHINPLTKMIVYARQSVRER